MSTLNRIDKIKNINEKMLYIPDSLSDAEKAVYEEITYDFKESINYKLTLTDRELIMQYCQLKLARDRAWLEYKNKPERYIRIITGISTDGKTPKVVVKENEHYKTWLDCNKHMEKILRDLRLTPDIRRKGYC